SLSVLAWTGERWGMPHPIHQVPGGWAATGLLQLMPAFFFVGGSANGAAWSAARRDGRGRAAYYRRRRPRPLPPVGVSLAVWVAFEVTVNLVVPGYPGVLRYGIVAFTPLWFIAAYLWVVLLTPLTATAHTRARWWTLGLLAGAVAAADLARFAAGLDLAGWLNTALVWVLIHQFGYFYRDGTLDRIGRWGAVTLL